MTAAGEPLRHRLALTQPQATGTTTVLEWAPPGGAGPRPLCVVLGHGAGSQVTHPLVARVAAGLAGRGYPVVGFNFAYAEAGRRLPDPPARLEAAFRDAVAFVRRRLGGRRLVLGGRSMGGRIASQLAAAGEPCAGLALLGYPLHPDGHPERLRTAHWRELAVPVLFVQGDRDALCDLDLLERQRLQHLGQVASRVHVLVGADHGFRVRGRDRDQVLDEVAGVVAGWLDELAQPGSPGPFGASGVGYSGPRRPSS
jgi:predicted alpha/beta-hydrolase family hydrolase